MRRFWSDTKGNIVVIFALAIVPVVGAAGAAMDYSLAAAYRTDMQKALDATALALARLMPTDQATLNTKGMQYFEASLGNHALSGLQLTVTPDVGVLRLAATGNYKPGVAGVLGLGDFEIGANAEARWGIGKVEIALALDNTGSMNQNNKLAELKKAANNLIDILQQAAFQPGDAKVAIVPFGMQVKVPTSFVNATWLRWDLWEETNGTCSKKKNNTRTECLADKGTWTPSNHSNWNGCIADRDKDPNLNYDVLDTAPTTVNSTKYPASQDCGSLSTIQTLTNDWTLLRNKINAMTAGGYTNVTIGLAWGWHLLSPTEIFTEGQPANTPNLTKYVILLTDGDNTRNRFTSSQSQIDARTSAACTNVKAAGIKVYTVRVIDGNATLLRNCATEPSMYFDVQNAAQLAQVFTAIGGQIATLHLSR